MCIDIYNKNNKKVFVTIFIIGVLVSVYFFVKPVKSAINQMVFYLSMLNLGALKEYILSFGAWAPLVSFSLMILQAIAAPLPAFMITFANAALFGWVRGAMLSWASAMAGATLCFYIARFLGRDATQKITSKFALNNIDSFFQKYGKHTILIARLLPFISFDVVSYAAGLTPMKFISFFIATGIGQLPATIVYSYVGGMLSGGAKMMMLGILTLTALSIFIYLIKKIMSDKKSSIN